MSSKSGRIGEYPLALDFDKSTLTLSRPYRLRIVFTSDITDKLRSVLDGASAHPVKDTTEKRSQVATTVGESQSSKALDTSRFKKAGAGGFKSTFVTSVMPVPSAEATPVPAANDEDLDGEAMDQDLDGEAMDEDLDGEAMQDDEDLDGEAMS